jgi:predicted dehydrogenase
VPTVYDDAEALLEREEIDFVDIITDVDTHSRFVHLAAAHRRPAICQKPMAPSLPEAERMVAACREAGVPLFVHENWRWQTSIRQLKRVLDEGRIGNPFRARIDFLSGYSVFENQPFLAELDQFILTDIGSHTLDVARFLFGEASRLYCQNRRVHREIKGEDVATVMLTMQGEVTVVCNMAYAGNPLEHDRFPETYIFVEGDATHARRYPPPRYSWANPDYDVIHSSIVPCNANLLAAIRGDAEAESTGADNLETVRLVFASYESATTGHCLRLDS